MTLTRRTLLRGGAAALMGVAASASLAGCASNSTEELAQSGGEDFQYETDVVVVGSGMGGFCAALHAQQNGANVIIVEANRWSGGGSAFCGGILAANAKTDLEGYNEASGYMSTHELAQTMYATFFDEEIPEWIEDMGAAFINPGKEGKYICYLGDEDTKGIRGCRVFFDSLEEIFEENGGAILFETTAKHIMTEGSYDKKITGLYCKDASGNPVTIKAKAVILACGGFQADSELRQRYFGNDAHLATIMAVPWNYGSAMKMGQELGASLQGDMGGFAALLASASPARELEEDAETFINRHFDDNGKDSVYFCADDRIDSYPAMGIIVNTDGHRFADEGARAHLLPQEVMKQQFATGFFIMDDNGWTDFLDGGGYTQPVVTRTVRQQFEEVITSEEIGGVVYEANSIEELADTMNATGIMNHQINKNELLKTINDYNALATAGDVASLYPIRTVGGAGMGQTELSKMRFEPIIAPPFRCWPVRPAVYACHGGLAIDKDGQVLDGAKQKIPGLYATTPAAGGIMNGYYTGSIALAATTGYVAGRSVASELASL